MLPRLTQSMLLDAGSCSMKLSCIGDGKSVLDWGFVACLVDLEGSLPLSEDKVKGAAALTTLKVPASSLSDLPLTVDAYLFGGGDIDLSLDDWKAS